MGWADFTRRQYARRAMRYVSDLMDREWGLISPSLPRAKRLRKARSSDLREYVAIHRHDGLQVADDAQGFRLLQLRGS